MHEMSIVSGILRIVENEARSGNAKKINSIELEIGQLAGIELDSLRFCYQVASKDTMADGAKLIIREIPGMGHCENCNENVSVEFHVAVCPQCNESLMDVFQGRELKVSSINVD
ncbi:MAG: hydrogenase maturation nickel metallochaperone HypA [bacterium]|nr:hydrogenase maturation nickel metallochaperone HypA [bacterium]